MKRIWFACCACLLLGTLAAHAATAVSNVRAAQRAGTNLVDINYDLSGGTAPWVSVEISSDGGANYTVPASSLSGNAGSNVTAGNNRKVTWDGGADWANQFSAGMKVKVTAGDTPLPPAGMVLIPAGSFQMGDSFGEGSSDELPVHTVYVSAFFMDKHEVTKALWDEVASWAASNGYDMNALSASGKAVNHPAFNVTWYECAKWCNARSQKEGLTPCYTVGGAVYKTGDTDSVSCNFSASGYRLPTQAEWEKAARGGLSGKRFPWGDTINHSQANYYSSSSFAYDVSPTRGYHPNYSNGVSPYTAPVGSFAANGYGLYDMAGNVAEWCWDWYLSGYYSSSPASDPRGPASGSYRYIRGGHWLLSADMCRSANGNLGTPGTAISLVGFRTARSLVP